MLPANLAGYFRKKVSSTSSALCFGCLVLCSPMRVFRQERKQEHNSCGMMRNTTQLRQRGNWRAMLGAGRLIHLKGTQLFSWIPDVNAEEQICFLLLSGNTNEKINSSLFCLLKTEAGHSVLLHQKQGRPSTATRLARSLGKSTHWTFLLVFCCGGLLCSLPWALLAVGNCFESLTPAGWSKHLPFIQTQLLLGSGLHHKEGACLRSNLMLLHVGGGVEKEC